MAPTPPAPTAAVLIVDDCESTRATLRALLVAHGFAVRLAATGEDALTLARDLPDLVVLDVVLPGMDGFEVCRRLKADPATAEVPVLLMSGLAVGVGDRVSGLDCRADGYLVKPVEPNLLLAHITAVLRARRAEDALRRSERRYRMLVEGSHDAVGLLAADGTVLYASPSVARVGGRSPAEVVGRSAFDWCHPDDLRGLVEGFRDLVGRPGAEVSGLSRYRHKDGSWRWAEATCTNRLGEPEVAAVVVNARDVTDKKVAEDEVGGWRNRYEAAVRATGRVLYDWDPATDAVTWGGSHEQTLGYTRDEMPAEVGGWLLLLHPDDRGAFVREADRVAASGDVFRLEYRVRRKGGSYVLVEDEGHFFREADGRADRMVGFLTDVTDRRRAEAEFRRTAQLLRAVADGTTDAVFVKDRDGKYLFCNPATAGFLGRPQAEVLGRDDGELFDAESARRVMARDRSVVTSGRGDTTEQVLTTAARGTRTFQSTKAPYRDEEGNVVGVVGISRDVTEFKRLEDRLRQAQKMDAVGRLAAGVAHDFNNLLTVILGSAALALEELPPGHSSREEVEQVAAAGGRAAALTAQLLAFGRKTVVAPRDFDLNVVVGDLAKLLARVIGENQRLVVRLRSGLVQVWADPGQVEQVVMNLVVNARDAMPAGGTVTVETECVELGEGEAAARPGVRPGPYVRLSVTDTGAGMTPEVRDRIWEPFFSTKGVGEGSGLGLATVHGIVAQAGGHVAVDSEVGRGSTFLVYLPRSEATPSALPAPAPEASPRGTETVLVVEDEDVVRTLTRRALASRGYAVLEAAGGGDALAVAAGHPGRLDLLLTDVVMPGMSGRHLAERLAAARPGVRVLYMSGYTDDPVVLLDAQSHFLQKPFTPDALARKVREVLDSEP